MSKEIRVAGQAGKGHPWNVFVLPRVSGEAKKLFSDVQYAHVVDQVRELARTEDPTHPTTVSVDRIEDFHELRDKGGVLGKLNIRVFFGLDKAEGAIVLLGVIKKKNDGPTPQVDKIRMRRRWRNYRNGDYSNKQR